MKKEEYIICSAIHFDDGKKYDNQPENIEIGYVIFGRRHHNCFTTLGILTKKNFDYLDFEKEQGFLTNKDRFVNRFDAAKIAFEAGQTSELKNKLFSEDLY